MMTLANYGIGSSKHKDPNSAKALNKSLQIRNRAETSLKHCLKTHYRIPDDKRIEILNGIKEYYSRVPIKIIIWNKYQTGQCIVDSILLLDSKFNPYKAVEAFNVVERMLINLVHQPWHKEFRRIFTYSGLFRLVVSDPLIGIEEVFKAAGFKQESNDSSMHLILPNEKMPQTDDGESVTSVIFDCLMAQVVLNNIIEIFENCCKASRQPGEHLRGEVNCFSWIQSYFRERTQYTNERACSNIQDLLQNITNHLSRLEFSAIKWGPKQASNPEQHLSGSQSSEILNHKSTSSTTNRNESSPILSAQERTRKFLAQQPIEDENLLKLSDDILKLPTNNYETNNSKKVVQQRQLLPDYDGSGPTKLSLSRPAADFSATTSEGAEAQRHNGYLSNVHHHYQRREGVGVGGPLSSSERSVSKLSESYDTIDHHQRGSSNNLGPQRSTTDADLLANPMRVDPPHNDRELLIPRLDRKSVVANQQPYLHQMKARTNHSYDQNEYDRHQVPHYNGGQSSRHHMYDRPSCYDESSPSSHQQYLGNHHHHKNDKPLLSSSSSSQSSRYGNSSNAKYSQTNHNHNHVLAHSRSSYWSCGSCTFNNQLDSEICEMCRNRRSSR